MGKFLLVLVLLVNSFLGSSAFWSLDTDLQFGYEIQDKSHEINAVIQAIGNLGSRSNVIVYDNRTRMAINSLNIIAKQIKIGSALFTDLAIAAASRSNTEGWHMSKIQNSYTTTYNAWSAIEPALEGLANVTHPKLIMMIELALWNVRFFTSHIPASVEVITRDVNRARVNSSLVMTPELLSNFIDKEASLNLTETLSAVRSNLAAILLAVKEAGGLTNAHGSVHELLSRSFSRDSTARSTSLNNFVNNYSRVRNNLLSSVATFKQTAKTGVFNFISRVQNNYDDSIVRRKFDENQLSQILSFSDVITSKVYNETFFQTSFDRMRDTIVSSYSSAVESIFTKGSVKRDEILDLQRNYSVPRYSHCLDELVADAQESSVSITRQYTFCLNERTSGIVVVIPSTVAFLSVIRDNINFILQQLNGCLSGQTTVAGRTAISDCIQFNVNNLAGYSFYLPITVQSNLNPVTQNTPFFFENCIRSIPSASGSRFDEIYGRCKAESEPTTEPPTESPTEQPTESSTTTPDWIEATTEAWTTALEQ